MGDVVNIGDVRITRDRRGYRPPAECQHLRITLDENGGIVECDDCKKTLSAYWALTMLAERYKAAFDKVLDGNKRLQEAKAKDVSLLAAQVVERAWRSRRMAPTCPHCSEAILPTDGFGRSAVNKAIALRRRAVKATP